MKKKSILIVEDEAIVSLDLTLLLEDAGYSINRICNSSDTLFQDFEKFPYPDLILMDIHIKGSLDGTEASMKIKELYDIPVIFLTAYADKITINKAKSSYPYGYIIKPYVKRGLLVIIEMALNVIGLEKEIKQREELFSATFKSIADAVIITDNEKIIRYLNPVALSMISDTDPLNKEIGSIFKISYNLEQSRGVFIDSSGKEKTLEIKKTKLDDALIPEGGYVWILTDITIPVFLEAQLRESQKMEAVGRLAGGIAHDFNNLLTVIMGYCSLIKDNSELLNHHDSLRNDINGILSTSQKAVKLTKQLLTFSNNQVHNPRYINLNSIILELSSIFDRLIPGNIELINKLTDEDVIINIDPVHLEQVLINLVVNSRDAIESQGVIQIRTSVYDRDQENNHPSKIPQGEFIHLSVEDDGMGIPEGLQSKIFEPFFSTKKDGKGVGLGLSTVYGIVQNSGGVIEVTSSRDSGCIFDLYFPRVMNDVATYKAAVGLKSSDMGKESILVVDEDEFVRLIMIRVLENKGYNVVEARNAGEALLLCELSEKPFELIITDLFMPIISGVDLLKRVKANCPTINSVFTSTHTYNSINDKTLLSEITYFIQKPFDPDEFSLLIRKSLDSN